MASRILLRRDTTLNWETNNPVLAAGEPGVDISSLRIKFGDGVRAWKDLPFAVGDGTPGPAGAAGKSAFELAKESGFVGTLGDWLASLKGPTGDPGFNGASAFEIARDHGFTGTPEAWLESLKGANGRSNYEIAVANGFIGTEANWLETLRSTVPGPRGFTGDRGPQGDVGPAGSTVFISSIVFDGGNAAVVYPVQMDVFTGGAA